MGDTYGLNFEKHPGFHSSFIFYRLTSYLRTRNVLFAMSSLEIICPRVPLQRNCFQELPALSTANSFQTK